ncbi:MAG: MmcQ/YjbR family DNA-binding protein [Chloroflexi bacterium]|nr:MmcQ/YjbR family DNA-binding protein [Chloroflexota bacterium]
MTVLDDLRAYCNGLNGASEGFPFDETTLVFKVRGKMFALLALDQDADAPAINLKCEPTLAEMLRETYPAVTPGYHMSKRHWNTVRVDGSIPEPEIQDMIDHSYAEVVKGLPKKDREGLQFKA